MRRPQPAIIFIFVTLFLDIFGIGVIVPILPDLVKELRAGNLASASQAVGWLGALYAVMQFIFSPVLGSLSDRFGRRVVILASLFGSGLDYLLMAWAPTIGWLYMGRIISGITGANFTAANAYIADVTPPEKRAAGYGITGAAFGLGFIAGPAVGGFLGMHSLRLPFVVSAVVTLLNWLYGVFVLPESLSPTNRRKFTWESAHPIKALIALSRWPLVLSLAGAYFLINVVGYIYPSLWVLYTGKRYGWTRSDVGLSLTMVGVMAGVVQAGLAGRILGAIGERRGLCVGLLATAITLAGYGLAPWSWLVYVLIVFGSIGGISNPAAQSLISTAVPPNEQGAVQGALNSLVSVAGIVAPILWTALFSWSLELSYPMPGLAFLISGIITLLAMGLAIRTFRIHKPTQPEEPRFKTENTSGP